MNALLSLSKWMLIAPIFVFGIFHFMNAEAMADMAPGGKSIILFTGACLILASVSILVGILDKLASVLLGVLLLLFLIPHFVLLASDPDQMSHILKNIVMASASFLYAKYLAIDNRIIDKAI